MIVTIEITDVKAIGFDLAFKSEITGKDVNDLNDWEIVFTALVSHLVSMGVEEEQLLHTIKEYGISFPIEEP